MLPELAALAPKGERRMGANPHANGGLLLRELQLPDFRGHALQITAPGSIQGQDTLVLGKFLRDVARLNQNARNFRIFGPDETVSNLLGAVFEVTSRQWDAETLGNDEFLSAEGQVLDSMLSEQQCQGLLEGYLPPDVNCLLSAADHCLGSRNYLNVMIAGKHTLPQWLTMDQAVVHCTEGIGIWPWASNDGSAPDHENRGVDQGSEPWRPRPSCASTCRPLKVRVINVVDLMKLQSASETRTAWTRPTSMRSSPATGPWSSASTATRRWCTG